MIETVATVQSNEEVSPGYRLLVLSFERQIEARAGQFAMLRPEGSFEPLLRRALAVYRQLGSNQLSFLYQVLGRGTETLARCVPSSKVEALIPLGNSWPVYPEAPVDGPAQTAGGQTDRAIVVAGGIGSASLLMLCEQLARQGVETEVLFGARDEATARGCGLEDFRALGVSLTITTDDGSLGERGFVTGPLERLLHEDVFSQATIYACGPWVMMSRVAEIAARSSVSCLVSLEAPMGCGFGVCVGCVVAVNTDGPPGYDSYKRVCIDGPIFSARTIEWNVNPMTHS
ncbi:MAG: dihydroorotate dehydrogenase electron transfer subunit [Acidobacteriota bacterium]